jgi:hypothetical protein
MPDKPRTDYQADLTTRYLFEIGTEKIRDQGEAFDSLDTKTGVILGFIVVSIPELLGFLLLAATENVTASRYFSIPVEVLLIGGLASTVSAALFGLLALRTQPLAVGVKYPGLIEKARQHNWSRTEMQAKSLEILKQSAEMNSKALDRKQRYASLVVLCASIGIFCYSVVAALLFLGMVPKGSGSSPGEFWPL